MLHDTDKHQAVPPPPPDAAEKPPTSELRSPELRSALKFMLVPGVLFSLVLVFGVKLPTPLLYGVAGVLGMVVFARSLNDPEWLLAGAIIYIPFSKMIVAPIAPMVNGINIIIGMLLVSWFTNARRLERPMFLGLRPSKMVGLWAFVSCFSAVTASVRLGPSFMIEYQFLEFKAWIDQFIIFYAFVNLIRDSRMAKRLVVYMALGYVLVIALGMQEFFEKQGYATIEKSRLLGPQLQPNDFAAFLIYCMAPFIAYFLHYIYSIKAWLLTPVFVLALRLLLTTFSRGGYLGLGFAGLVAGYVRGKKFLIGSALIAAGLLLAFPEVVPDSLRDRMSQTKSDDPTTEKLDKSAETRLILWKAGLEITKEYPILGLGFKAFPVYKEYYTETAVEEADNHNMYLFISSQMGIPALIVFLVLLYRMYAMGAGLYRRATDPEARIIGLGGAVMVAGVFGVNMFGSRMTGIDVDGYVWIYLAVMAHLWSDLEKQTGEVTTGAAAPALDGPWPARPGR